MKDRIAGTIVYASAVERADLQRRADRITDHVRDLIENAENDGLKIVGVKLSVGVVEIFDKLHPEMKGRWLSMFGHPLTIVPSDGFPVTVVITKPRKEPRHERYRDRLPVDRS